MFLLLLIYVHHIHFTETLVINCDTTSDSHLLYKNAIKMREGDNHCIGTGQNKINNDVLHELEANTIKAILSTVNNYRQMVRDKSLAAEIKRILSKDRYPKNFYKLVNPIKFPNVILRFNQQNLIRSSKEIFGRSSLI